MHLVRYLTPNSGPQVGVRDGVSVSPVAIGSLGELFGLPLDDIRGLIARPGPAMATADVRLLPPVDGRMEVWAAGVTYERSRSARMEESATADVYSRVYDATRPELFFKAAAWRVVTDGEPVSIRRDSPLNVPEPELAAVANAFGEIVGWTVCDDVSSRSIEGDNPLYLPQAKVYAGSCALATGVRPAWEVDITSLPIRMDVTRSGSVAWSGHIDTGSLHRQPDDLVGHLFAEEQFPDGVVLSTGTGIVPDMDFGLAAGDTVAIAIDQVGTLTNPVVSGKDTFTWLADADAHHRPPPS